MEKHYEGVPECYYRVSAKALIKNKEGKFLLAKEDTGLWDIPGGGIDHGEEIHEALKREIKEEMGLTVTKVSPQPAFTYITESSGIGSPKKPICLLIFETEVENLDFTPSSECTEIGFFTATEARNIELYYPNQKVMESMEKEQTLKN